MAAVPLRMWEVLVAITLAISSSALLSCQKEPIEQDQRPPAAEPVADGSESEGDAIRPVSEKSLVSPEELYKWLYVEHRAIDIIDIRSIREYSWASIEGSWNIPFNQLSFRSAEINKESVNVILAGENMEHVAEFYSALIDLGMDSNSIFILDGGIEAWVAAGYETVQYEEPGC